MFVLALALVEPLPVEYSAQYFSSLITLFLFRKIEKIEQVSLQRVS